MRCSPSGSPVHVILQVRILEWLPWPPPGDLPHPGVKPRSPALQADSLPMAAAAAESLQSCLTLCDPMDSSPPGSPVPGILQAGTLEGAAIAFSTLPTEPPRIMSIT